MLCSEYEFYLRKGEFVSLNGKKTPQTILVVEEHPLLLKLVKEILEDAHFTVLHANSAKKAIQIEAEFPGSIDLLLSDVMMQGMSGPDLAKRLKAERPKMRIILMSAYPDGELLVLNYGWHFIHKTSGSKTFCAAKHASRAPTISTRASSLPRLALQSALHWSRNTPPR